MDPPEGQARTALWHALLAAVLCLFAAHVGRAWDFTVDDAGIAFAYARNVAAGHGLTLTPGTERVEAPPNLLWVLLLVPAEALRVTHETLAKGLGTLFGAGALAAVAYFPSAAYRRPPHYYDLAAPALAATFAHSALWTASGLETGLFAFLASLSVTALAAEEADAERFPWSSLALTALFATRPDGALYLVALGVAKAGRAAARGTTRQDVLWVVFLLLGIGSLELFRLAYFAHPLPNGYYAPRYPSALGEALPDGRSAGWSYLFRWIGAYRLERAVLLAPLALAARRAPTARAGLTLAVAAGLLLPVLSGGDWMEEWRLLAYVTPLFCLLVAEALRAVFRLPLGLLDPRLRRWFKPALAVAAAWLLLRGATRAYGERFLAIRAHTTLQFAQVRARARYFREAARALDLPHATLLDPDAGGTAYGSGLGLVDLSGLGDPAVARTRDADAPGLREVIFGERRPTFAHLHGAWRDAVRLDRLEELEGLYVRLPPAVGRERDEGALDFVRRESLAAPWTEEAEDVDLPPGARAGLDGYTVASDGLEPGEPLTVELTLADPASMPPSEVRAVPAGGGAPHIAPVRVAGGVLPPSAFHAGERPWARVRFWLRPGRYWLRWRSGDADLPIGSVTVATGAGARASAALAERLGAALARDRLRDARRVALRLRRRVRDVPGDATAVEALARYARALAERAVRLGEGGAWAMAAEAAIESQRFVTTDVEHTTRVQRLAERMADASRLAERRGDLPGAFALARDAVLIDPRRSWMRRRAERLRATRRGEYDGGRELAAYRTAVASLHPGDPSFAAEHRDRAIALLGAASRWTRAATLAARVSAPPVLPWARLAAARGHLARAETSEALALARDVPCAEARDPELSRAFRALLGRSYRPDDPACEAPRAPGDAPWSSAPAPFDADEGSFEAGRFGGWTAEGRAFGAAPARGSRPGQGPVNGWRGRWFASSFAVTAATGVLRSRPFTVAADAVSFLVGGASDAGAAGVRLVVDGHAVLRASGAGDGSLRRAYWDVRPWRGREAVVEVYDEDADGYVMADDFLVEPALPAPEPAP